MRHLFLLLLLVPQVTFCEGRWGHEPYGPPSPLDVCVSAVTGQIAVAETEKNQVAILDPGWKLERILGADAGVERPVSVAFTPSNQLAVLLGADKPRVKVFSSDGKPMREFACPQDKTPFANPQGVAVDDWGNSYVFDTGNHRVVVFDENGGYLFDFGGYTWTREFEGKRETIADRLESPVRGEFLPDGRLIVVDWDGPVVNPKTGLRAGTYSLWRVDAKARKASYSDWAYPSEMFPTSHPADVAVDRRTGEIYYADGDFPLVDHDFVRRAAKIGDAPDASTNFMPYLPFTGIRGIAVARNGEPIIAEADKGIAFAVPRRVFDKGYHTEWPRKQRLIGSTETTATLQYDTLDSVPTVLKIAPAESYKYPYMPEGAVEKSGESYNTEGQPVKERDGAWGRGERHRMTFTGLDPGRRYAYQFMVTERAYPWPLYSQPRMATTRPPKRKTQYIGTRMIVLLFTNIYEPVKDVPPPGPMTAEEIEGVKQRMEVGRMFYWVNSRCNLDIAYDWVLVDKEYGRFPLATYAYWPDSDHQEIDRILAEKGMKHADTSSLFVIYGHRHWDAVQRKWVLSGSGGNTWGSVHDGSSITTINAGGDTAWLMVHEHGHGIDIASRNSGQTFHFNHFHGNWLSTRYGTHFDGNKAIARDFKDLEYWSNLYGKLVLADDADGDGIPDDDPTCPLDEKRFGSDPGKKDTDGDGLDDLQEMLVGDGLGTYPGFDFYPAAPYYLPNPRSKDTDGDGIQDRADPYPLYPVDPTAYELPITLDGKVSQGEYTKGFNRTLADPDLKGAVRIGYTKDYLVFAVTHKALEYKKPTALYVEVDGNDDGLRVGSDNSEINVRPREDGTCEISNAYNDNADSMSPSWRSRDYPMPQDFVAKWARVGDEFHLEFAIPRTPEAGLFLEPWEQIGVLVQLTPEGQKTRRLFQSQERIRLTLR
jgi:DNA-binding beta-propeller fold protein YncE